MNKNNNANLKRVNYTLKPTLINGVRIYADSYYGIDKNGAVWQTDGIYRNGFMTIHRTYRGGATLECGEYNRLTETISRRRAKHTVHTYDRSVSSMSFVYNVSGKKLFC